MYIQTFWSISFYFGVKDYKHVNGSGTSAHRGPTLGQELARGA